MQIIGMVGFAGSGKGTAAHVLQAEGFESLSFADALKDCLAAIFGWSRTLLEGVTSASREFRETIDPWWAERLSIPNFTPRYAMQHFGTETMRQGFHAEIWTLVMEHRLLRLGEDARVVFADVRYPNEMNLTRRLGGQLIRIQAGDEPEWFELARQANQGDAVALQRLRREYRIHDSETAWIGQPVDHVVRNDGSIDDLEWKIRRLVNTAK